MKQAHVFHMQAHITISGFVQGVGFRHFLKSKAQELEITGYVQNLPDGGVEAVLQSSKEKIEKMIELCRKGPFLSNVENVEVRWEESEGKFEDFSII